LGLNASVIKQVNDLDKEHQAQQIAMALKRQNSFAGNTQQTSAKDGPRRSVSQIENPVRRQFAPPPKLATIISIYKVVTMKMFKTFSRKKFRVFQRLQFCLFWSKNSFFNAYT
jgi:hypothetical protein